MALLEALRRHAENITVFCQAGAIAVPKPQLTLLGYLEGSIVAGPPTPRAACSTPRSGSSATSPGPARALSPPLPDAQPHLRPAPGTLVLPSTAGCESGAGASANAPLGGNSSGRCPGWRSGRPTPSEPRRGAGEEVLRVRSRLPRPSRTSPSIRSASTAAALAVSAAPRPRGRRRFINDGHCDWLLARAELAVLISRRRGARRSRPGGCPAAATYVLSPRRGSTAASPKTKRERAAARPATEEPAATSGLHAKLYLFERATARHLYVGSANATDAAFGRNVELLVELGGRAEGLRHRRSCSAARRAQQDCLRSLLEATGTRRRRRRRSGRGGARTGRGCPRPADRPRRSSRLTSHSSRRRERPFDLELPGPAARGMTASDGSIWPATLASASPSSADAGPARSLARFEARDASRASHRLLVRSRVELRAGRRAAARAFVVPGAARGRARGSARANPALLLKDRRQVLRSPAAPAPRTASTSRSRRRGRVRRRARRTWLRRSAGTSRPCSRRCCRAWRTTLEASTRPRD